MGLIKDWAKSHRMTDPVRGTLHVSACTSINPDSTSENYNLDGVVSGDGILPTAVNHSGIAKASKWPYPGADLPVTVDRADPTRIKIEWHEVKTGNERGKEAAAQMAERMRGITGTGTGTGAGSGLFGAGAPGGAGSPAVTVLGGGGVYDLRGMAGAREEILDAVAHAQTNPDGVRQAVMDSLAKAGVSPAQMGAGGMTTFAGAGMPAPAEAHEDPAERLQKLDKLKEQKLVDDAEYARLRAQILADV